MSSCACSEHGRSCFQDATHDTLRADVQRRVRIRECTYLIRVFSAE
jgi:hypothetical protein